MLFPQCWQRCGVYCLVPRHFGCYLLLKAMKFAEMCTQFQENVVEYLGKTDNIITGMNRFQCQRWCSGRGDSNCVSTQPCCSHLSAGRSILCTKFKVNISFPGNRMVFGVRLFKRIDYGTENICAFPHPNPGMSEN